MSKIRTKAKLTRSSENTKALLLAAAKKLFARHGFNGTTVQQISDEAGVNVSMISHHFDGKEGLYRTCLQGFGDARLETLERLFQNPENKEEFKIRLEIIINELVLFHLKEPQVTAILFRDINSQHIWGKQLQSTLFGFTAKLAEFIECGKKKKIVKNQTEPLVAAGMIYLYFAGLIQNSGEIERMLGVTLKNDEFRTSVVKQALEVMENGIFRI